MPQRRPAKTKFNGALVPSGLPDRSGEAQVVRDAVMAMRSLDGQYGHAA